MWGFVINLKSQKGFNLDVLEDIFIKYCGYRKKIKTRKHLFLIWEYCKNYNTIRNYSALKVINPFAALIPELILVLIIYLMQLMNLILLLSVVWFLKINWIAIFLV
jgi:hypothetical protein